VQIIINGKVILADSAVFRDSVTAGLAHDGDSHQKPVGGSADAQQARTSNRKKHAPGSMPSLEVWPIKDPADFALLFGAIIPGQHKTKKVHLRRGDVPRPPKETMKGSCKGVNVD
jgi:hypothetical protein